MNVDALHGLQKHHLPSLHPYEVVQSRVELVMHLTRKVVKAVETCDEEDLTWKKKEKNDLVSVIATMLLIHTKVEFV